MAQFAAPVDLFIAYTVSTGPTNISLLKPDFFFQALSSKVDRQFLPEVAATGVGPRMANVTGPIDANPLTLSVADLSPGIYTVYLLVTPSGRLDSYYFVETSFAIP